MTGRRQEYAACTIFCDAKCPVLQKSSSISLFSKNDVKIFKSLDFLYVPAPDIESSVKYYTQVLGGKLLWKIHAYDVWVACIDLSNSRRKPYVLLADHIEKNDMMLIYQVENLENAANQLRSRGWKQDSRVEIPPGPCCTFRDPANNALVIYENKRPYVMQEFRGKIDS